MKVSLLSQCDVSGGAARAAYRLHHALRNSGIDSQMLVNVAASGDWTVQGPTFRWGKHWSYTPSHSYLIAQVPSNYKSDHPLAIIGVSGRLRRLNASDADLLHLHWIQGEMLSIPDIGRITKPVLWTLHDMWAFCGAEHTQLIIAGVMDIELTIVLVTRAGWISTDSYGIGSVSTGVAPYKLFALATG